MTDVQEVRPDAVAPEVLAAFERALDDPRRPGGASLVGPDDEVIELPAGIHALLVSVVENLKIGKGVSVIPLHAELTTVEAAQLLNISAVDVVYEVWGQVDDGTAWRCCTS